MNKAILELIYNLVVKYWEAEDKDKFRTSISVIKEQFEDNFDEWNEINHFIEVCDLYCSFKQSFDQTIKIYEILKGM